MISLALPEAELSTFALAASDRVSRREPSALRLDGTVEMGQVISIPLDISLAGDDSILKHFLQTEAECFRFHLLRFSCGFLPKEGEAFDRARLEISLRREDDVQTDAPIAWSMQPRRLSAQVENTKEVQIGSKLEILDLGVKVGRKTTQDESFLEAFGEQSPRPFWEFKQTSMVTLQGSFQLHLIVRSPRIASTRGEVSLSVIVRRTTYRLFYKDSLFPVQPMTFRLT